MARSHIDVASRLRPEDVVLRFRQELEAATEANAALARELEQTKAELGAALGAALSAVDNPKAGIEQLAALLATARKVSADRGTELAPHWRMAEALLSVKTDNDTPSGGSVR